MAAAPDPLPAVLLAVPAVILACRAGASLVRRFGQPAVIGEIATGIVLGPSLLGWLWPASQSWLFPSYVIPFTGMLGNIGLLAFMFLVGLELDLKALRGHSRTAFGVSGASIALPLALGVPLALALYADYAPEGVGRLPFVLFVAVSVSVTAFPVLARILTDRGMYGTPTGALAMACAAVDDVAAWCLLAVVVAVTTSSSAMGAVVTAVLTVGFVVLMLKVVRPLLARIVARADGDGPDTDTDTAHRDGILLAVLFSGLCLAALATDRIGIHALFGAFLFGVVTPRGNSAVTRSAGRLRAVTVPLLLPLFFVHTGLKTDLAMLAADPVQWLWAGAVLVVAVCGKWGGSALAARATGRPWSQAMTLGALMNCRGLTELVVLNIGLELGVIGPKLFTMLVLMALVTTAVTAPAVDRLERRRAKSEFPEPALVPDPDPAPAPEPAGGPVGQQVPQLTRI
ncbi:cation:proton antiporter [Streptomyces sp. NPDC051183]|uniref:cation:proton antiporter domain-containing protein n=1 Tax=unclassified Streptomyces TaxID=2593676 RepID=UPI003443BEF1